MNNKIIISKKNENAIEEFFEKECDYFCKCFNVYVDFEEEIEISKEDLEERFLELYFGDCEDVQDQADGISLRFVKNKNNKIIICGIATISIDLDSDEIELF